MQNAKKQKRKGPGFFGQFMITMLLFITIITGFGLYGELTKDAKEITISQLVNDIEAGQVESVAVENEIVSVTYKDGVLGELRKEQGLAFSESLVNYGLSTEALKLLNITNEDGRGVLYWITIIFPILIPLLILLLFAWFFLGQSRAMGSQLFSFGKSRARMASFKGPNRITFKDVAGSEEEKAELSEYVDFLKSPRKYFDIGARIPKGLLLIGSPGTGKTLLARAVAGEANVPFFSISGSEFVEMFVGVGASRVRDLFNTAKKESPSIIFIDEIDAVGRVRGLGTGGGNDEREQTLNQILVEMDGFVPADKVIVIAATNRPDVLDAALIRPGRFDRRVTLNLPRKKERLEILKIHTKGKPLADDVNIEVIARRTVDFSGADLQSVANEAAILAARESKTKISQKHFLEAIEKVVLGPEKRSIDVSDKDRKLIAYHEAGHALLASVLPYADPVQKITIIPRGGAGGYVLKYPDDDRSISSHVKQHFLEDIMVALGGYVVEKMIFGQASTGPCSDLEKVTATAKNMVTRWGMSEKVGPVVISSRRENAGSNDSSKLQDLVDQEVRKIISECQKKAEKLVKKHRKVLDKIAETLLEVKTMERDEFELLISGMGIKIENKTGK